MESSDEDIDNLEPQDLFNSEPEEDEDDDGGEAKEDEAEEEKPLKREQCESDAKLEKTVKPKRIVKNPRVTLNYDTLTKPNGLPALKKHFEKFKFKGGGHEMEDLTNIMGILQQWMCYQLFPSYDFESCMTQLEILGNKKKVKTLMKKYRMGISNWGENDEVVSNDEGDNEPKENNKYTWLDEEIANAPSDDEFCLVDDDVRESTQTQEEVTLTAEQLDRIAKNRKLAEERRMKRLSQQSQTAVPETSTINEPGTSFGQIDNEDL